MYFPPVWEKDSDQTSKEIYSIFKMSVYFFSSLKQVAFQQNYEQILPLPNFFIPIYPSPAWGHASEVLLQYFWQYMEDITKIQSLQGVCALLWYVREQ